MPKKMVNIKEILAANLKENRRKRGLTQEKFAELADISLHYLSMLESASKFPSGDMLEKLAKALDIQPYQFFNPSATPEGAISHLEQSIIDNINEQQQQAIAEIKNAVKESIENNCKKCIQK